MNSDGFTYTLEALIAGAILLSAMGFYFSISPYEPAGTSYNPAVSTINALLWGGSLKEEIYNQNFNFLDSQIEYAQGKNLGFRLYVYNKSSLIYQSPITIPEGKQIYSSGIVLSGNGSFSLRKVRLVVWYK
ncbi:hypothetical protein IPdc08_00150 [archaeon]|nr:hypothetical protein IPdc08_00150 [archaeon]